MRILIIGSVLALARVGAADPPQPLIGIDDLRTHGPVALNHLEPSLVAQISEGPDADDAVMLYTLQLGLSPTHWSGKLGEIVGITNRWGAHVRWTVVDPLDGDTAGGPMTVAVHRYFPVEPLQFAPLLHVHIGLSFAVATPWLSGRMEMPPPVLQVTNSVQTELHDNGWSLRPFEFYGRVDFLACRAIHLEAGGSPEAFVSTAMAPTSYHLRGRVEVGFSLGCSHSATSKLAPLAVMLEYRGRTRLYQRGSGVTYYDQVGAGLQYNVGRVLVGAFYSTDPGHSMFDYYALLARVQVGFWGTR